MRILITGATGFVGRHLRRHLLAATDWEITGTAYPDSPADPRPAPREHLVALDLRDASSVRELLAETRPDYIVHLAAQAHVPTALSAPWDTLENNILGELNLFEACLAYAIKPRIIVVGSSEEYGRADAEEMPLVENHPLRPENPYAVSKVTQDVLGYQYFIGHGLPVIRVRPFNHIGPGQSSRFVLPAFASQIAKIEFGQRPPALEVGNLAPKRDFTDVRDVVRAYRLLLTGGTTGDVYNIASGRAHAISDIVNGLLARSTTEIDVRVDPERYRPTDVPMIYGSAEKLSRITGWSPRVALSQTLDDVLDEWRVKVGAAQA